MVQDAIRAEVVAGTSNSAVRRGPSRLFLTYLFNDHSVAIEFLKEIGLLRKTMQCNYCGRDITLRRYWRICLAMSEDAVKTATMAIMVTECDSHQDCDSHHSMGSCP
jgi:hypothetical protein